jgi:hypothetical protein
MQLQIKVVADKEQFRETHLSDWWRANVDEF